MDRLSANAADLAADYKARGMSHFRAWGQFVADRALRPEIDAPAFYAVFARVSAAPLPDRRPAPAPVIDAPRAAFVDPEFSDYGRRVVVVSRDGQRLPGALHRTMQSSGGGTVYEVALDDRFDYARQQYGAIVRLASDDRIERADEDSVSTR